MFGKKKTAQKVCANGHVMAASWETCPYCSDTLSPAAKPSSSGAAPPGGATQMLNLSDIEMPSGGAGEKRRAGPTVGWIVALNGQHKGEDFRLKAGKNVIGTAADADIVLTDKKVSRKHCTIRYEGGEFQIADLDSSNGTFVNEERTQKHDLIDNDLLRLGDIQFKFKSVN